ncbi:hypothetical protein H1P_1750008 [Hyella patelloides LEGE 07179]|uniref:Uncharacterized protein n=1 Tax=Hyella patelloides LEGE 07179 TaxID=945734 RepID=A0A563VNS6_9CYAN|nr:hypothetical protein H1P_1750008 [Hyella patelloides LEGE 07179]
MNTLGVSYEIQQQQQQKIFYFINFSQFLCDRYIHSHSSSRTVIK